VSTFFSDPAGPSRISTAAMGRGKLYTTGFRAQLRLTFRSVTPKAHAASAASMDTVLRRSLSIKQYVLRLDTNSSRRELIYRIAGVRHTPTDRADATVLPMLRRFIDEAEKGTWVQLPDDARGLGDAAVFVSYELVEADAAERELRELQSNAPAGCCISTTEVRPESPSSLRRLLPLHWSKQPL